MLLTVTLLRRRTFWSWRGALAHPKSLAFSTTVSSPMRTGSAVVSAVLLGKTDQYRPRGMPHRSRRTYDHRIKEPIITSTACKSSSCLNRGGPSMLVALPDNANGLADVEAHMGARYASWRKALGAAGVQDVDLKLPRWRAEWTKDLVSALAGMGMHRAFQGDADLKGMGVGEPLVVSDVLQKTFVDPRRILRRSVDEPEWTRSSETAGRLHARAKLASPLSSHERVPAAAATPSRGAGPSNGRRRLPPRWPLVGRPSSAERARCAEGAARCPPTVSPPVAPFPATMPPCSWARRHLPARALFPGPSVPRVRRAFARPWQRNFEHTSAGRRVQILGSRATAGSQSDSKAT